MRKWLVWTVIAAGGAYFAAGLMVLALRWIDPFTTSVHIERRIEAWRAHQPYHKRYQPVPLAAISPHLRHAVVAAEDSRFAEHAGIDWTELEFVLKQDLERGKLGRGGSTISQQLVKNLFLTTSRSLVRKGLEFLLVPLLETLLSKDRILELYLNVIEWGPGVYGAEAAARYWYRTPSSRVSRDAACRLAAIVPAPRRWRPERMGSYASVIEARMVQMGW